MASESLDQNVETGEFIWFIKAAIGWVGIGIVLAWLSGCTVPVDTHGADVQLAGRCKLLALREDRGHISFGLIPMMIDQANVNARRQEIYDSCLQAGGSRELVPEVER